MRGLNGIRVGVDADLVGQIVDIQRRGPVRYQICGPGADRGVAGDDGYGRRELPTPISTLVRCRLGDRHKTCGQLKNSIKALRERRDNDT